MDDPSSPTSEAASGPPRRDDDSDTSAGTGDPESSVRRRRVVSRAKMTLSAGTWGRDVTGGRGGGRSWLWLEALFSVIVFY